MEKTNSILRCLLISCVCVSLFACAHTTPAPVAQGEKLIWASETPPSGWIDSVPRQTEQLLYFVGISNESEASEQDARNNARKDAIEKVIEYYGDMVKIKSESINTSFGLSSTVVDPTEARREFTKHFSANVSKQLAEVEVYKEKWEKSTGVGWKVYALCSVPKDTANQSLNKTAEDNVRAAHEAARKAANQTAKEQARNAADFWNKMKEDGFAE